MDRRDTVLTAHDVQQSLLQVYLIPTQADQFRYPQTVAIGDQDQGGIALAVAADAGRSLHQRRHLLIGQVFPAPVGGIRPAQGNFPVFDGWRLRCLGRGARIFAHGKTFFFPYLDYFMESLRPPFYLQWTDRLPPCAPSTNTSPSSPKRRNQLYTACPTSTTSSARSISRLRRRNLPSRSNETDCTGRSRAS